MNYKPIKKMKTTKEKIIDYLRKSHTPVSVKELVSFFGISNVMVHRHIKKLLQEKKIQKHGSTPKVFYSVISQDFYEKVLNE